MEFCFHEIVENIFNRWTALKLAVEHGMAKNGIQTAIDFIEYTTSECLAAGKKLDDLFIADLLEDIMDEQFDTVCEDESIKEVSSVLIKFFEMAKNGQTDLVRSELTKLPPCTMWITNNFQVKRVKDDSSSSDDENDEMTVDNQQPATSNPSTSGSTMEFEEEDPDPGWTLVKKGKKFK